MTQGVKSGIIAGSFAAAMAASQIEDPRLMSDMAERLALHEFTENAYLNYSMYVIMDRALPFIGDGL